MSRGRKICIIIAGLAAAAVGILALRPLIQQEIWLSNLDSRSLATWRDAAQKLFERGDLRGLRAVIERVLLDDPGSFKDWQERLFAQHPGKLKGVLPAYGRVLDERSDSARLSAEQPQKVKKAIFTPMPAAPESGERARREALDALRHGRWRIPEVVPILEVTLSSKDPVLRARAAYLLSEFGPMAAPASEALERNLKDSEPQVRWAALRALGAISRPRKETVAALIAALKDSDELVACEAARALAKLSHFDAAVEEAVPALTLALGARERLRACAAEALRQMEVEAPAGPLVEAVKAAPEKVVRMVEPGLGELARWGEGNLEDGSLLRGYWIDGRTSALHALSHAAARSEDLLPLLESLLEAPECELRHEAAARMSLLGARAAPALPSMIDYLKEGCELDPWEERETFANWTAVETLISVGDAARLALIEALRSEDPRVRLGSLCALGSLEAVPAEVADAARPLLQDLEPGPRAGAALLLHRIDPRVDIVPSLLAVVQSDIPKTLGNLDPRRYVCLVGAEGKESVPLLSKAIESSYGDLSSLAVRLLVRIGREAGEPGAVLPAILKALEAELPDRRASAALALGELYQGGPEALRLLLPLLRGDKDPSVRAAAAQALACPHKATVKGSAEASAGASPDASAEASAALLEALRADPEVAVKESALLSLAAWGEEAQAAADYVKAFARAERDERLKRAAVSALCAMAPEDPEVVDLASGGLRSPSGAPVAPALFGRFLARDALPAALVPSLSAALGHASLEVRLAAARVLARLGTPAEKLLGVIAEGLADCRHQIWIEKEYEPRCAHKLRSLELPLRREAARCAADVGPAARELGPKLEDCLRSRDGLLRVLAAEALWRCSSQTHPEVLVAAARKTSPRERLHFTPPPPPEPASEAVEALRILAEMGPAAKGAAGDLEKLLEEPRPPAFREVLAKALAAVRS